MRFFRGILVLALAVVAIGLLAIVLVLRASLPVLDGSIELAGLKDPVVVQRDSLGVATLRGSSRADLARATGFVHAQDRFFQMDLARRRAAGELAALFGPVALEADRNHRFHRFRQRAREVLAQSEEVDRALLQAYAGGVNQGLGSLSAPPWEYLALGAEIEPWLPEDSLLVSYSMFLELNDSRGSRDTTMALLDEALPAAMVAFILPPGTEWDAPLEGEAYQVPPIPGPDVFAVERDDRSVPMALESDPAPAEAVPGSNNWAVGHSASADGFAMVANDMHLGLRVPNTFYRLRLELLGSGGREITGVTLPGLPVVVAGSNGEVAWGFTNSYGDWTDVVLLETDDGDASRYLTPDGWQQLSCVEEPIPVAGELPVAETVCESIWGPVIAGDGRAPRAIRWLAHDQRAVNMELLDMETADTVDAAVEVANRTGMPPQNIVVADRRGRIAWTITGQIPIREGFDPNRPASWATSGTGWTGWLQPEDYPRIIDPPSGRIWTANARVVDGADLEKIGDGGYALGARASRIRDMLSASDTLSIADMLEIQLDDDAFFYRRWRDLALSALAQDESAQRQDRQGFQRLLERWTPRASTEAVGFRLVYEFRQRVLALVFEGLTGPVRELDPGFSWNESLRNGVGRRFEGPAWELLAKRPQHLLHPAFHNWNELLLAAVDATVRQYAEEGPLNEQTWGRRNTASIRHPLSGALFLVSPLLDMPAEPLNGATHMPRVQQSDFGASERFAVAPGHEDEGFFHMPTGQSGHPLSPFYRAGHQAWVDGDPTPFLPGPPVHHLWLDPSPAGTHDDEG